MIFLSLLVCILGLIMYLLAKPEAPKVSVIGLHMFWVGLLVFLLKDSEPMVSLLRR